MYNDDIKELLEQKREAKWYLIKEYIILYFKALINSEYEMSLKIKKCLNDYLTIENNEKEVIIVMKELFGSLDEIDVMEDMFEKLDTLFFNLYDYYDNAITGFHDAIDLKQSYRANLPKRNEVLDDGKKNELIKKLYDKVIM